jgi:F-type H+-transporting ATPase subunit delta
MTSPVTREAYGAAKERLEALVPESSPERLRELGNEIMSVARLITREPRLRRALVDISRSPVARAELLRNLLTGKVSDETLAMLSDLVAGRWSVPSELLDATERLGVDAVLASAERADDLTDVEDELFRFGQIVAGNERLAATLGDSTVDGTRRAELARALLDGKAKPATVRLVELALTGFGGRNFDTGLTRLVELAAARREATVAYVVTAVAPTDSEERQLVDRLSRMYGRQISLKVEVRPEIIGGISVRVGSDLYDGTVRRRLSEARAALTK